MNFLSFISWHSSIKKLFLIPCQFILVQNGLIDFYFSVYLIHYFLLSLFILMFKLSSVWLVRIPSGWLLCLLTCLHHLSTFQHKNMFQVHLVFPPFQTWNEQLLQRSLIPFSKEWYIEISWVCSQLLGFLPHNLQMIPLHLFSLVFIFLSSWVICPLVFHILFAVKYPMVVFNTILSHVFLTNWQLDLDA